MLSNLLNAIDVQYRLENGPVRVVSARRGSNLTKTKTEKRKKNSGGELAKCAQLPTIQIRNWCARIVIGTVDFLTERPTYLFWQIETAGLDLLVDWIGNKAESKCHIIFIIVILY